MKALKITLAVILGVGLVMTITALSIYRFNFSDIRADVRGSGHVQARTIEHDDNTFVPARLDLDIQSHNVTIRTGDAFLVNYHLHTSLNETSYYFNDNGAFHFRMRTRNHMRVGWSMPSRYSRIYITVPAAFNGDVYVQARSGNVLVENIDGANFTIDVRSGNLSLENITGNYFNLTSRSGNISLGDVQGHWIRTNARAGNSTIARGSQFTHVTTITRSGNTRVTLVGDVNEYSFSFSTRSGNNTLNGSRISDGSTHRPQSAGSVSMTTRSGNNYLRFV